MSNDKSVTEAELTERAVAPRVTENQMEECIASVNYINVGEALEAVGQPVHPSHRLLTLCIVIMINGFKVVGESACVYAENYDRDIGQRLALADAKKKIWPLMGYALADHQTYDGSTYWAQPSERGE